jgi:large subunit ribosomal protein L11
MAGEAQVLRIDMAKKVKANVRIQIEAGKASPAPPIGPSLAPHGINLMAFCKEYNARTAQMVGNVIPAEITVYSDNSFTFVLRTPPTPNLIRKAAGVDKGSGVPNRNKVGKITTAQVKEIAEQKMRDLNAIDLEGAMAQVKGTARSMGVEIVD